MGDGSNRGGSTRTVPRRLVFSAPPGALQTALFELLLSRELHGVCVDRTTVGHAGLVSRPWRRNLSFPLRSETPQPMRWEELQTTMLQRELHEAARPAQLLVLTVTHEHISGIALVHCNHTSLLNSSFVGGGALLHGQQAPLVMTRPRKTMRTLTPCEERRRRCE